MKKFIILFLVLLNAQLFAQVPEPVNNQNQPVLIYNALIHIGDGNTIEKGFVSFENGKIAEVSSEDLDLESDAYQNYLKINANGNHLYPGLILPNSKVGLEDISAVTDALSFRGSLGIEYDLSHSVSKIQAKGISGIAAVSLTESFNEKRPVVSVGFDYEIKANRKFSGTTQFQELPYENKNETNYYLYFSQGF